MAAVIVIAITNIRIIGMDCGEGDHCHHRQASSPLPLPEEASATASSAVLKRRNNEDTIIIITTIVNKTMNMYNHHDDNEGRHVHGHQLNGNGNGKKACCNRYCGAGLASSSSSASASASASANTQMRTCTSAAGRSAMSMMLLILVVVVCLPILPASARLTAIEAPDATLLVVPVGHSSSSLSPTTIVSATSKVKAFGTKKEQENCGRDNNCGSVDVTLFDNPPWLKEEQRDNDNGGSSKSTRQLQRQRQLQQQTSSTSIIQVLDMGLDIPSPDDNGDSNVNVMVKSNGVTLTVYNKSKDQPMQFLGLEVYMAMGGSDDPMSSSSSIDAGPPPSTTLQLYVRKLDDHDVTTPLELESSVDWDMLEEMPLLEDVGDSSSNYEFVSVPLLQAYTIPANSAVTLLIVVAQSASASIVTLSRTSRIVNESSAGSDAGSVPLVSIKSGTAIRNNIPSRENHNEDPWVPIPYSAFLGSIFYGFPNTTEGTSLAPSVSPYYTTDTTAVWKLGDVPARTYGIAFDVYSKTGCNITSLDIHTPLTTYMVVEVYTRQDGSSYSTDADTGTTDASSSQSWTLTSKVGIHGLGQLTTTPLPPEQFKTIEMPANSKVSFYITTTQVELASIHTASNTDIMSGEKIVVRGANVTSPSANPMQDTTIDIMVGQTVTEYPVFSSSTSMMSDGKENANLSLPDSALGGNAIFSGKIHYENGVPTIPTLAPSSSPTVTPPDLNPELTSQLKLSLTTTGISRRTLRRLLQQGDDGTGTVDGSGSGSGNIMSNKAIRNYFEEVGRVFVKGMVNKNKYQPRITVRRFVVSPDLSEDSVSVLLMDDNRSMLRGRRDLQQNNATLDVYTTILGEYSPLPVVDFSSLTESAFNNEGNGEAFVGNLKSDAVDAPTEVKDVFQQIQGVRAVRVVFPKPANLYQDLPDDPPPDIEPAELMNFLKIVYIASGAAVLLLVVTVTICMLCRRKREEK
jgi:hypothetical protein